MSIWKSILNFSKKISLGFVFISGLAFMLIRTDFFFPVRTSLFEDQIIKSIIFFMIFFMIEIIPSRKQTTPLFKFSFLRESWIFLLSGLISLLIFYGLGILIKGDSLSSINEALAGISLGSIALYALLVAIPEQWIFFKRIPTLMKSWGANKIWSNLLSIFLWIGFHTLLGKSIWVLLFYIPLGLLFAFVRDRFSPITNMADSGAHFAWDIFVVAFFN